MNDRANEEPTEVDQVEAAEPEESPQVVVNIEAQGGEGGASEFGEDGETGEVGQPVQTNNEPAQAEELPKRFMLNENGVMEVQDMDGETVVTSRELTLQELTEIVVRQDQQIALHNQALANAFRAGDIYRARKTREILDLLAPDEPRTLPNQG